MDPALLHLQYEVLLLEKVGNIYGRQSLVPFFLFPLCKCPWMLNFA